MVNGNKQLFFGRVLFKRIQNQTLHSVNIIGLCLILYNTEIHASFFFVVPQSKYCPVVVVSLAQYGI